MATKTNTFSNVNNGQYQQLTFSFDIVEQDIANNRTKFSYSASIKGIGGGSGSSSAGAFTISGAHSASATGQTWSWSTTKTQAITSGTFWVTHAENGTLSARTLNITVTFKTYTQTGTSTISISLDVPTIPRETKFTAHTLSSASRNSFAYSWTTADTIDRWRYRLNGGSWSSYTTGDRKTASGTISGLSASTTYEMEVEVRRKDSGLTTTSKKSITTLAIASVSSAPTITSVQRDRFTVNFSTNRSISGFQVSTDGGSTWLTKQSGSGTNGSQTITGLSANTTYSVRVRVYDGVHTSSVSAQSSATSAKTLAIASPNTPTLSSRTCTQAVINWTTTQTVSDIHYKLWDSDSWRNGGAVSNKTSGSITITGLSPNTTYTIRIRVKDSVHGTWSSQSASLSVTTYRLTTISGTDFNLGSSATCTTSRATTSTTHDITLQGYYGGTWNDLTTSTGLTSGATLTPNSSQRTSLENANPTVKYATMRWKLVTKWSGVTQGTTYSSDFKANIIDANPTLVSATYVDAHSDSTLVAWKGGNQKILRNVSLLRITLGKADAIRGATLSYAQVTIGGKQTRVNFSSGLNTHTGLLLNPGIVDSASNLNVTITVADSRGNTGTQTITVEMVNYQSPTILTAETQRLNNYEPQTNLLMEARYFEVKNGSTQVNYLEAEYRVKQKPSGSWGSWVPIAVNSAHLSSGFRHLTVDQFMSTYSSDNEYDVEIRFKDYVSSWSSTMTVIFKGIELLAFHEDRMTTGVPLKHFDGVSEIPYLLDNGSGGGNILQQVYPVGSIYMSTVSTNPATLFGFGTWTQWGSGRVPIGVNTSDSDFNTVEKTGGSKTNTIGVTNLPSHTHSFSATTGANNRGHTHSVGAHSHGLNSHTHSVPSHTHSIPALSGTATSNGAHTHDLHTNVLINSQSDSSHVQRWLPNSGSIYASIVSQMITANADRGKTSSNGAHTHSVTTVASTTGARSTTTGGASGSTADSTAFNSGAESQNHTHTVSGTTGGTGSGTALNTMDPYITCYMWKRTA